MSLHMGDGQLGLFNTSFKLGLFNARFNGPQPKKKKETAAKMWDQINSNFFFFVSITFF